MAFVPSFLFPVVRAVHAKSDNGSYENRDFRHNHELRMSGITKIDRANDRDDALARKAKFCTS